MQGRKLHNTALQVAAVVTGDASCGAMLAKKHPRQVALPLAYMKAAEEHPGFIHNALSKAIPFLGGRFFGGMAISCAGMREEGTNNPSFALDLMDGLLFNRELHVLTAIADRAQLVDQP